MRVERGVVCRVVAPPRGQHEWRMPGLVNTFLGVLEPRARRGRTRRAVGRAGVRGASARVFVKITAAAAKFTDYARTSNLLPSREGL